MKKKDIDSLDIRILNTLSDDAYITNRELASKVGLSDSPTLHRVKCLLQKGVITRQVAKIKIEYFGFNKQYYMLLAINRKDSELFIETLKSFLFVTSICTVESSDSFPATGSVNIFCKFSDKGGKKLTQIKEFLDEHKESINSVNHYIVGETHKDEEIKFEMSDID